VRHVSGGLRAAALSVKHAGQLPSSAWWALSTATVVITRTVVIGPADQSIQTRLRSERGWNVYACFAALRVRVMVGIYVHHQEAIQGLEAGRSAVGELVPSSARHSAHHAP